MKQSKKLLIFGILAAGIISLVASSPTIYALVEPHITINMEPAQTTKPFEIKDDLGSEVFSINPDGSLSSGNFVMLHFEQKGTITIPQEASFNDPEILAEWRVVKDPGVSDGFIFISTGSILGQVKRVSGTSASVGFHFYISDDGIDWDDRMSASTSSTTFTSRADLIAHTFPNIGNEFFAFGGHTNAPDTVGEVKDFAGTVVIMLPAGYSLERVL